MVYILKMWHKWGWAFHVGWALCMLTAFAVTYKIAIASNTKDIANLQQEHKDEKMAERMAVQEALAKDTHEQLDRIVFVQGKIFERLNQLADRPAR